jgi:hypothetical protein
MAIRTHTVEGIARKASHDSATAKLAALPAGSIVGVYQNRVDAVGAAVQISVDSPETRVWVASGEEASFKIRAARSARSLLTKLAGGLSDDEAFVEHIVDQARTGQAVLVLSADGRDYLPQLAGASHVVEFGRWTTREVCQR